ncbi:retropepsin-like aspartic protease family protein [Variovorax sp. HJSM1_2]|uniref:retropepsin-like aspartic protease family protein n=1 Tax=Variovorax sp. HJSM1_2 TaxID=3366263 RepID=UPI003BEB6073
MRQNRCLPGIALGLLLGAGSLAQAQSVVLSGMLGNKALLVVDGAAPKTVAPGETYKGVKVVATRSDAADLEFAGKRLTLRIGDTPVQMAGSSQGGATRVVLTADSRGHFFSQGAINGNTTQFMVDTGASVVAMSQAEAERLGVNYKNGQPVQMSTANGVTQGWRIRLATVRVGDVQLYDVEAVVTPAAMPFVLLGNSVLTRFQMNRTNDQMVLERRY